MRPLRFVNFLSPRMHAVYAEMADYVGRRLGEAATIEVGAHDQDVFERGEADFGFI